MKLVEGMEEFLLHTLSAREELDIVYEKDIRISVLIVEIGYRALVESAYKVAAEGLAGNVNDVEVGVVLSYLICDSCDEVSFTHSGGTVDEQRIVVRNSL